MEFLLLVVLTPHNYIEWKPKILLILGSRHLYQITMETKEDPNSVDKKNYFFNGQDMAFRIICMYVSSEIQYHVISLSTPDEAWIKLEVLFRIKEDCEECMQDIDKTKPMKEQASNFEETFACTMHASQVTLAEIFAHPMHASQEPHAETYAHPLILDIQDDISPK